MGIVLANSLHIPLKDESVHCIVTSPPYHGLRKYDIPDSIWDGEEGRGDHQWGDNERGGLLHENRNFKRGSNDEVKNQGPLVQVGDGRRYGGGRFCLLCGAWKGQLGGEPSLSLYVSHLVQIFREIRRVLRGDGVLWLNLGDSYASGKGSCYNPGGGERSFGKYLKAAGVHYLKRSNISDLRKEGLKPKDLCEIPSEVVRALRDDGWWLRFRIPWIKMNSMPSSCTDRPTATIEYVFLLSKSQKYFYDTEAVRMPAGRAKPHGKNSRMNVDRDPAHLLPYRSEKKVRKIADGAGEDNGRYRRDSDWFFESLKGLLTDGGGDPLALIVNPQPLRGAHYSSFPEKLAEPLIRAGTSERGCCPKCGAPHQRILEKEKVIPKDYEGKWAETEPQSSGRRVLANVRARREAGGDHDNPFPSPKTIGWQPTCSCDAGDPVPCMVLDPFGGSGTVGVVAERLDRKWILLDLGYHDLQRERLVGIQKEMPRIG